MRWVALQVMSADQGQLRSPLSPRNAGASLPLSPFRFPGSHSSGVPLGAPLRRHPVLVDAPWQVLLDLLPLSPNSFIAGSAATLIALSSLGSVPQWQPGDIDIFCLMDTSEFVSMIRSFVRQPDISAIGVYPCIDDPVSAWKYSVYVNLPSTFETVCISFMLMSGRDAFGHGLRLSMPIVMSQFDIDICRVAVCSADEWQCTDAVLGHLASLSMTFTLSTRSMNARYITHNFDRVFKYTHRGFRVTSVTIDVSGFGLETCARRVEFFNVAMSLLQQMMTMSFKSETECSFFDRRVVATPALIALDWHPVTFTPSAGQSVLELLTNLPLSSRVFIAGEYAAWLVLVFKSSATHLRPSWIPHSVHVFCAVDRSRFLQIVQNFIDSSSCLGSVNAVDAAVLASDHVAAASSVGKVVFHLMPQDGPDADPMLKIIKDIDISFCRVVVAKMHGFFCSPSVYRDIVDRKFDLWLLRKSRPTMHHIVDRVHLYMSHGIQLQNICVDVAGIHHVPHHEKISMFHNGMVMCMSLTNAPRSNRNHHPELVGSGGVKTLYPGSFL